MSCVMQKANQRIRYEEMIITAGLSILVLGAAMFVRKASLYCRLVRLDRGSYIDEIDGANLNVGFIVPLV